MTIVLVGTHSGCRVLADAGEIETELTGRRVSALTPEFGRTCLAVIDDQEVWRRDLSGAWSRVAATDFFVQCVASVNDTIFCGGMDDAVMLRIPAGENAERLTGFDNVPQRDRWFAGGPPLGVRSLCVIDGLEPADSPTILAAVHVGGIPRSSDGGLTWTPTIPITFDVHEVRSHPSQPGFAAAATAAGLCITYDSGRNWKVISEGLEITNSLAVGILDDEVLFSIQDGPFAEKSQIYRWRTGDKRAEQVRNGLPEYLDGKVDTGWIATGVGRTAIVDAGGNLWLSNEGSRDWKRIATGLPYVLGLVVLQSKNPRS